MPIQPPSWHTPWRGFAGVTDPIIQIAHDCIKLASRIYGIRCEEAGFVGGDSKITYPIVVELQHSEFWERFDTAGLRDSEFARISTEWRAYRESLVEETGARILQPGAVCAPKPGQDSQA